MRGGQRHQLVAVDHTAVSVYRQHAVAVAVEGKAHVVLPLRHPIDQPVQVGGAAIEVDVDPVGLIS